jgi:hypothetical protein
MGERNTLSCMGRICALAVILTVGDVSIFGSQTQDTTSVENLRASVVACMPGIPSTLSKP